MNELLKKDSEGIRAILDNTVKTAMGYFEKQQSLPPGRTVKNLPLIDLPENGIGADSVIDYFAKNYLDQIGNSAGPRYFGFVTGGSTPASVAGDWMVSALDQNNCGSNDSVAPQLERVTLHFLKQLFGIDPDYFGTFVTGATMSNFVGLSLARQWAGEKAGINVAEQGLSNLNFKIISGTPHSSIYKSLSMLGLGRKSLIKIDTLPGHEAIDIDKLENFLKQEHQANPIIVVANAGTVNTVDFDDLEAIGLLKQKYGFWLHLDAAFGGFAAASDKYKHLMRGVNHADSICIDAHKWLNVPYDSAMQFTRHKDLQMTVFQNSAAYLGDPALSPDFYHYTPENSRRWRSLPAWFSLMAYGKEGHAEIVERNCSLAQALGQKIDSSEQFKLLAPVRMNVICFTLAQENVSSEIIKDFLNAVRADGRAFFTPTVYQGKPGIRAAFSNWMTTEKDIEITWQALLEVYSKMNFHLVTN